MLIAFEITDMANGEPQYTWVKHGEIHMDDGMSTYAIARRIKRELGWHGLKCLNTTLDGRIEIRPYGGNQMAIAFI